MITAKRVAAVLKRYEQIEDAVSMMAEQAWPHTGKYVTEGLECTAEGVMCSFRSLYDHCGEYDYEEDLIPWWAFDDLKGWLAELEAEREVEKKRKAEEAKAEAEAKRIAKEVKEITMYRQLKEKYEGRI